MMSYQRTDQDFDDTSDDFKAGVMLMWYAELASLVLLGLTVAFVVEIPEGAMQRVEMPAWLYRAIIGVCAIGFVYWIAWVWDHWRRALDPSREPTPPGETFVRLWPF